MADSQLQPEDRGTLYLPWLCVYFYSWDLRLSNMRVHRALQVCGLLWLIVGFGLFRKGLMFAANLANQSLPASVSSLSGYLIQFFGSSQMASVAIVITGLALGFLKAKYVLAKAAERNAARLESLEKISFSKLFDLKFLVLMGAMIFIGMLMNVTNMPIDWRALIDVAVGCALIQGSSNYFRLAWAPSHPSI